MANAICLIVTNNAAWKLCERASSAQSGDNLSKQEANREAINVLRMLLPPGEPQVCFIQKDRRENHVKIIIPEADLVLQGVVGETPEEFVVVSVRFDAGDNDDEAPWNKIVTLLFYDQGTVPSFVDRIDGKFWGEISALPSQSEYLDLTEQRLNIWDSYLRIISALAEKRRFSVDYGNLWPQNDWSVVHFELHNCRRDMWSMLKGVYNEQLNLASNERVLGTLVDSNQSKGTICVELEENMRQSIREGRTHIPRSSSLLYNSAGTLWEMRRQQNALNRLAKGDSRNKNLGSLLFDLDSYAQTYNAPKVDMNKYVFENSSLDKYQKQAVLGALEAQDFYLIKGPPGTGKTTVIAEICAQATKRGKKVLIASQTNVAVDNVISKFMDTPNVRAIRFGNENAFDEQGLPFSDRNVVHHWLEKTQRQCEKQWEDYRRADNLLKDLRSIFDFAQFYLHLQQDVAKVEREIVALQHQIDCNEGSFEKLSDNMRELQEQSVQLGMMENALDSEDLDEFISQLAAWDNPMTINANPVFDGLAEKLEAVMGKMNEFIRADGDSNPQTPYEVLQAGVEYYQWYQHRSGAIQGMILRIGSVAEDWTDLIRVIQPLQNSKDRLQTTHERIMSEMNVYRQREDRISKCQTIVSQLKDLSLKDKDVGSWVEWVFGHLDHGHNSLVEKLSLSNVLEADVRKRLVLMASRRLGSTLTECFKASQQRDNLFNSMVAASRIKQTLENADRSLQAQFGQAMSDSELTEGEVGFARKVGLNALDMSRPTVSEIYDIEKAVEQLVNGYLGNGLKANVSKTVVAVLDNFGSWFGGMPAALKKTGRLQGQLAVVKAGAALFTDCLTKWSEMHQESHIEISSLKIRLINQANVIVAEIIQELHREFQEDFKSLCGLHEAQEQEIRELEGQQEQIASVSSQLQRDYNAKYHALTSKLATETSWPDYPVFAVLVNNLKGSARPEKVEESYTLWVQQYQAFQETVTELRSFELTTSLHEAIASMSEQLASTIEVCRRELESLEKTQSVLQTDMKSMVDKYQSLEENCHIQQIKWDNYHARLELLKVVEIALGKEIHGPEYLQKLQKQYDNVASKLQQTAKMVGWASDYVTEWVDALATATHYEKEQLLPLYLEHCNLIGATCSQTARREFKNFGEIDYVIVDEVSKATPPELLMPLLHGKTIILVGDDKQLPPMIGYDALTELAEEVGCAEEDLADIKRSLFAELWAKAPASMKTMLRRQYRMHSTIMDVINQFYDDQLAIGSESLDQERNHDCGGGLFAEDCHAVWVDVPQFEDYLEEKVGTSFINLTEIKIIQRALEDLDEQWAAQLEQGAEPKSVGVITFYGAQERRIRQTIDLTKFRNLKVKIGTVDRFQGMEYPVVIVSMVRNNKYGNVGHAKVPERINVALSRAQELLVLIGCGSLFCQSANGETAEIYSRVADNISARGGMEHVHRFLMD